MTDRKIPQPTVLGNYELIPFLGDKGERHIEITSGASSVFDTEAVNWDRVAAIAGLLNACDKTLYDLDKEMAENSGRFPDRLSNSLAADINTLIRHAMALFKETHAP